MLIPVIVAIGIMNMQMVHCGDVERSQSNQESDSSRRYRECSSERTILADALKDYSIKVATFQIKGDTELIKAKKAELLEKHKQCQSLLEEYTKELAQLQK